MKEEKKRRCSETAPHTKNSLLTAILKLGVRPQHRSKVELSNLLVILHHKVPPPLLALLALHLILINRLGRVELGERLLEVLVDLVVPARQAERRALDSFEDRPVGLHVLDGCEKGLAPRFDTKIVLRNEPLTANCLSIWIRS